MIQLMGSSLILQKVKEHVRSEVLMAVTMKITVFWDVALCSLVKSYQHWIWKESSKLLQDYMALHLEYAEYASFLLHNKSFKVTDISMDTQRRRMTVWNWRWPTLHSFILYMKFTLLLYVYRLSNKWKGLLWDKSQNEWKEFNHLFECTRLAVI